MLIEARSVRVICNALIDHAKKEMGENETLRNWNRAVLSTAETILYYVDREEKLFGKERA